MSKPMIELVVKQIAFFTILAQIRQQATDEEDRQLTESIRLHGVLQPVGARSTGSLVWGHRRLRCAIAAGLKEVPCVILDKDMTEGQYLTLQMLENVQRADLNPYDMWQGCVRLQEANNWQLKDVARALSLDPATVTRLMSVSKCIPAWQDALRSGKVGIGDCYSASRLSEAEQPGLLALKLSGATRDELAQVAKKTRTVAKGPTEKLARVVCPLSTGRKITVTGADMDLDALIEALAAVLESARKGNKDQLDVKTWARVMADKAKAAG